MRRARGFTLVELVAVIVLLGLLAAISTQFLSGGARVYVDSLRRDALAQQGRIATERVARELRNALPGSVRVASDFGVQCVEFYPIVDASTYRGRVSDAAISSFEAVNFAYISGGAQVAIYPIDNNSVYGVGTVALAGLRQVDDALSDIRVVHLTAPEQFANESPQRRFFIVSPAVSFCAQDGALSRYEGYATASAQPVPPASGGWLLADNIRLNDGGAVNPFTFTAGTLERAGVVTLDFRFMDNTESDEWVRFSQQVFVRNTP